VPYDHTGGTCRKSFRINDLAGFRPTQVRLRPGSGPAQGKRKTAAGRKLLILKDLGRFDRFI